MTARKWQRVWEHASKTLSFKFRKEGRGQTCLVELRLCNSSKRELKPPNLSCTDWVQKATLVENTICDWEQGCDFEDLSCKTWIFFIPQFVNWAQMEECSLGSTGILWKGQVRLEGVMKCWSLISAMYCIHWCCLLRAVFWFHQKACELLTDDLGNSENHRTQAVHIGWIVVCVVVAGTSWYFKWVDKMWSSALKLLIYLLTCQKRMRPWVVTFVVFKCVLMQFSIALKHVLDVREKLV